MAFTILRQGRSSWLVRSGTAWLAERFVTPRAHEKSHRLFADIDIGGMLAATLIAIFLIPAMFYLVEKRSHRKGGERKVPLAEQPAEAARDAEVSR